LRAPTLPAALLSHSSGQKENYQKFLDNNTLEPVELYRKTLDLTCLLAEKAHTGEIARSQIKRLGEGAGAQHPVVRHEVR